MTNLDRWKPLAQEVMRLLALGDDPQRLVVIATALAGAASVGADGRKAIFEEAARECEMISKCCDKANIACHLLDAEAIRALGATSKPAGEGD